MGFQKGNTVIEWEYTKGGFREEGRINSMQKQEAASI